MDHLLPYYLPSNLPGLAGCGRGREAFLCPLVWPLSPPEAWGEALSCGRPHLIQTGRPYQDGHPHFPRARSRGGQRTGCCGQEGPGQGHSVSGRARQPRGAEAPSPEVSGASCRGWGSETSWNTRAPWGWGGTTSADARHVLLTMEKRGMRGLPGRSGGPSSSSIFTRLLPPCSHLAPP